MSTSAATEAASELLALDVFKLAGETGQPVTEAMIRTRITELLGHPPGCRRCRGLCKAAATAQPAQVLWLVRCWQRSTGMSGRCHKHSV